MTCTQENLAKGLNIVSKLSDKVSNLPILSNVLLEARKDGLTLTATNLEIGIKTKVRGKIDEEGEFTVGARLITDFVNSLKRENIALSVEDKKLTVKGENHQTTIRGLEASDFPVIPEVDDKYSITTKCSKLSEALARVVFAMSVDEARQELNGALLQVGDKECIIVATDSYRLSASRAAARPRL